MSVTRFEPCRDPFRELDRLFSMAASGTRAPLGMPMDVYRGEEGSYHVEADLPSAGPDSIEVTVEHGALTIRAERTPHYGDSDQVIVAERPQGSFTRQLSLGEGADSENLTASYADGVLHVTIPASSKAQARRVKITRAAGGGRAMPGGTAEPGEAPAGSAGSSTAERPWALPPKADPGQSCDRLGGVPGGDRWWHAASEPWCQAVEWFRPASGRRLRDPSVVETERLSAPRPSVYGAAGWPAGSVCRR